MRLFVSPPSWTTRKNRGRLASHIDRSRRLLERHTCTRFSSVMFGNLYPNASADTHPWICRSLRTLHAATRRRAAKMPSKSPSPAMAQSTFAITASCYPMPTRSALREAARRRRRKNRLRQSRRPRQIRRRQSCPRPNPSLRPPKHHVPHRKLSPLTRRSCPSAFFSCGGATCCARFVLSWLVGFLHGISTE